MPLWPAAVERLLCPPCAWRVELRSPYPPTECAARLNERRVKNIAGDLVHRPGRSVSELRWTGDVATDHFQLVEAGLAGHVRALGTIRPAAGSSIVDLIFRLEPRQLIWDALLLLIGWGFVRMAPQAAVYIMLGVAVLFVLTQLRRRSSTSVGASRLVGLVQDAIKAEVSNFEGGARITLPERG